MKTESPERFTELFQDLEDLFEPTDELEQSLVANIAVARSGQWHNWSAQKSPRKASKNGDRASEIRVSAERT